MYIDVMEEALPTIVIATVKGDIHDIGKNLVVLMLKNYGYTVIDMGKDIPAEEIVETAIREHTAVIGLSALMTTTMMRMQDVVDIAKEKGYRRYSEGSGTSIAWLILKIDEISPASISGELSNL